MKAKSIIAALLMMVTGLQTAQAQGFRVYKSDGTVAQFSFRTDSIVFYDGIGSDMDFGPFTPVNQCIVGTWYKSKTEKVTFREDGTTDYVEGVRLRYKFLPYQGNLIIYTSRGTPRNIIKIYDVTPDTLVLSTEKFWTRTPQKQYVTSIVLSDESLTLQLGETHQLTATVMPEDADNRAVTWKSSNSDVAVVDGGGVVTAIAEGNSTITCTANDGSGVKATCEVKVSSHEYVDLGLPSGTLWATCNIGASSPEEYGDYFAWGETTGYIGGKTTFIWETYKYYDTTYKTVTKYCTTSDYGVIDNKTELEPEDDAATVNWGSSWQMPSIDQLAELINSSYTTTSWTTLNGVSGRMIISKSNGKRIFLPAAGYRRGTSLYDAGSDGYYWSRSLYTSNSMYGRSLYFDSSNVRTYNCDYGYRCYGRSVRPVRKQ